MCTKLRLACALITQSCPTLCDPMDCSPPGSSVHGLLQARILGWVAIPSSRASSWPRDWTWVSCIGGRFFTIWCNPILCASWLRWPRFLKLLFPNWSWVFLYMLQAYALSHKANSSYLVDEEFLLTFQLQNLPVTSPESLVQLYFHPHSPSHVGNSR